MTSLRSTVMRAVFVLSAFSVIHHAHAVEGSWRAAGLGGFSGRGDVIVIENVRMRLELGADATCVALIDKRTGKNLAPSSGGGRVVDARIGRKHVAAQRLSFRDGLLTVGFAQHDTELVYQVKTHPDWILFRLERVRGTRPERLTLFRIPVSIAGTVGTYLNSARGEDVAVCLLAANLQSDGRAADRKGWTELRITTQDAPGPRLEGAAAALIVAPPEEIRAVVQKAAVAFGMPTNARDGVTAKELPGAKGSYWFLGFGENEVDKVIALCDRSGIRQVMLSFGAWSTGPGHYAINRRNYPGGIESLKASVTRLHEAGILVGAHTFASKVKKTDPYVTPVPDKRFWKDMQATLAETVTATQTTIRARESLAEWPGSPVCARTSWEGGVAKHREVVIGDEIVRYVTIGSPGTHDTFLGCERGAWKTRAASHDAGTAVRHFGVDGCINGYIIDQETSLLDEVTSRLADVFNTCGFDMVYFDGGEDVDKRRFNHYVTRHQAVTMSKFTKRPIVHMGTIMTHGLWHSFARAGTVDHYMNTMRGYMIARGGEANIERVKEVVDGTVQRTVAYDLQGQRKQWHTVKEHVDRSVRRALTMQNSLMPSELGWFGIWPKNAYSDGLQLDEFEYLMVKSLAYDQPISLQTSFSRMEAHPLTPQILEMARTYEEMRLRGPALDEVTRAKLRQLGKDFVLVRSEGVREFIGVREVPEAACSGDRVRAFVGTLGSTAVATLWHIARGGTLELDVEPARAVAVSFAGDPIPLEPAADGVAVSVNGGRTTLLVQGMTADELGRRLAAASFEEAKPVRIWLQAEDCRVFTGSMTRCAGGDGAFSEAIVCAGKPSPDNFTTGFCEYVLKLPHRALWSIWGRMRYPSGNDDSFWLVRPDTGEKRVLGNCGADAKRWHWGGSGAGSTGKAPGQPIRWLLPAGTFTLRVRAREGRGTPSLNPRLDALCITDDPDYVPTDADARAGFGAR
jgi:hypothetical protein